VILFPLSSCYFRSPHPSTVKFLPLYFLLAFTFFNVQCTMYTPLRYAPLLLTPFILPSFSLTLAYTVRKMDLILRSIERMLQTQLSMARRFKLQVLRRYNVKFSKLRKFTLEMLRLDKLKSTGGRRTNILRICSP
jgi:hypothetical protein